MEKYLTNFDFENLQKLSAALGRELVFVDLETTGLVHDYTFAVIEIGLVSVRARGVTEFNTLVDPGISIPPYITQLTGISNQMVKGQPKFSKYIDYFNRISKEAILMGYNSKSFDSKGLEKMGRQHSAPYIFSNQIDVRYLYIRERNMRIGTTGMSGSLTDAADMHGVQLPGTAHRAGYDIALTALIAEQILDKNGLHIIRTDVDKIQCADSKTRFYRNLIS